MVNPEHALRCAWATAFVWKLETARRVRTGYGEIYIDVKKRFVCKYYYFVYTGTIFFKGGIPFKGFSDISSKHARREHWLSLSSQNVTNLQNEGLYRILKSLWHCSDISVSKNLTDHSIRADIHINNQLLRVLYQISRNRNLWEVPKWFAHSIEISSGLQGHSFRGR